MNHSHDATRRKRRGRRLKRGIVTGFLLALILSALPWIVAHTPVRDWLVNRVIDTPNLTATSEAASFGWLSPMEMDGLKLQSSDDRIHLDLERVTAAQAWPRLLGSLPQIGELVLEAPSARLNLPLDQAWDIPRNFSPSFTANIKDGSLIVSEDGDSESIIDVSALNVTVHVEGDGAQRQLRLEPVQLFSHRTLNPKFCNRLLQLMNPGLQDAISISGQFSLSLNDLTVPMGLPREELAQAIQVEGELVLDQVTLETENRLLQALAKLVADIQGKEPPLTTRVVKNTTVKFAARNGKLFHEGLQLGFPDIDPDLQIHSSGYVGLDDSLDLRLEIPRLDNEKRQQGPIKCHVTGTIRNPKLFIEDASLVIRLPNRPEPLLDIDGIDLNVSVEEGDNGRVISVDPVEVLDHAQLDRKLASSLMQLVDPEIQFSPQVSGEVSMTVDKLKIPLAANRGALISDLEVHGTLSIHEASSIANTPMRTALVKLLADLYDKPPVDILRITQDADIDFELRDGRFHYTGLRIGFPDIDDALRIRSEGSVGIDETVDLTITIPRLGTADLHGKGPLVCHVTGTVKQPVFHVQDGSLVVELPDRDTPLIDVEGVDLTMRVVTNQNGDFLTFEPFEVFQHTSFDQPFTSSLLHLIDPEIRLTPELQGEISVSIDHLMIPVGTPKSTWLRNLEMHGKLEIHEVVTTAQTPLRRAIIKLLADANDKPPVNVNRVAHDTEVDFELRQGRFHYTDLNLGFPDIDPELKIVSTGSIGLDESLDLQIDLPRLDGNLQAMQKPIRCTVTGTVRAPKISVNDASLVIRFPDHEQPIIDVDGVNLDLTVDRSQAVPMLQFKPVVIFDRQRLTSETSHELLSLIAPTLGNIADVEGQVSLTLDQIQLPLSQSTDEWISGLKLSGQLQLHEILTTVKTPLLTAMVKVLSDMHDAEASEIVRIAKDTDVAFELREGRLFHEGLQIGFPDLSANLLGTSRGSVGIDRSLDLDLRLPTGFVKSLNGTDPAGAKFAWFKVSGTLDEPKVTELSGEPIIDNAPATAVFQNTSAQETVVIANQTKAIFRISRQFLAEVSNQPIVANLPIDDTVMGFKCTGNIRAEGTVAVDLLDSGQQAIFAVAGEGQGRADVTGCRGLWMADGSVFGNFSTTSLVKFDGRQFAYAGTTLSTEICANIHRVTGRRDRLAGRALGAGVQSLAQKMIPRALREAKPLANTFLKNYVEEVADEIIMELNQKTPIEDSINRLFEETQDWVFHMSSDDEFLQASLGPPDTQRPPVLPKVAALMAEVRVEAWLQSTNDEAEMLAQLSQQPLAKQLVAAYLKSTLPELAAVGDTITVDAVGTWVLIRVGNDK